MKGLLFCALFFLYQIGNSQNLIQNGSFEEYYYCPEIIGDFSPKYWYSPTNNTPDYFNSCSTDNTCSVPINFYGFQYPQDGNAYAGAVTSFPSDIFFTNRDYITNILKSALKTDTIYCLGFYINTPERDSTGVLYDNIGIYFSADSFTYEIYDTLPYIAQLETPDGIFYTDTINWIKVEFQYKALGGEKYMTIGNFKSNANTDTISFGNSKINYYYYDNFSLIECSPPPPPKDIKIPNVFTPNLDGANEVFKIENLPENSGITIYSRWGNIVYSNANYGNNWDGEMNSDGVYYYVLMLPSGESKHGTVTIIRNGE